MRAVVLATLMAAAASGIAVDRRAFLTRDKVDALNKRPNMTWKASLDNGRVKGATLAQIKALLGSTEKTLPSGYPMRQFTAEEQNIALPAEFDSATNWPECKTIPHIYDQSNCGSCWAVGAASAISDRYCTTANLTDFYVSARDMMSCCNSCGFGCNGGSASYAWTHWFLVGLVTEECQPYPFAPCGHHSNGKYPPCSGEEYVSPPCSTTCTGNSSSANMTRFRAIKNYGVRKEEDYMRELVTSGPFEVAFTVYDDFVAYKSGVYQRTSNVEVGGHAVRIVGYGTLDGVKYWKIANSWNEDWGMDGYFLIKRGDDECGIESSGVAGIARH